MALGLRHGANVLVDYDPQWPAEFAAERDRIAGALGGLAKGIEHYGSTAVPGLRAKPILDILVGLDPLSDWRACHDPLLALGYDYAADAGVPGHHVFGRGRDRSERTHLVHLAAFDGPSWAANLAFRDALRADPQLRADYAAAKQDAAEAAENRAHYNALKSAFFERLRSRPGA